MGKSSENSGDSFIEKVEEVAIAVKDADEAANTYENLFGLEFDSEWTVSDDDMKVKSAKVEGTQIQMLDSTSPDGLIAKFIKKNGEGIHHIAFRVKDIEETVRKLREKEVKLVPEEPIKGNATYIFVHPKSTHGVLIELMEIE